MHVQRCCFIDVNPINIVRSIKLREPIASHKLCVAYQIREKDIEKERGRARERERERRERERERENSATHRPSI